MTDDDLDRISLCLKVLTDSSPVLHRIFEENCRHSLSVLLSGKMKEEKEYEVVP